MFLAMFLSRFVNPPSDVHLGISKRALKYLKGCTKLGIWYSKTGGVQLEGYTNSDRVGCVDDNKSTSGYIFSIKTGIVSWSARKQDVVAQLTPKAKYIASVAFANQIV